MGSRIEHRAEFSAGLAAVVAAVSGEKALLARLQELGGDDAELLSYTAEGDVVRFELRQGIKAAKLPQAVRTLHKGDLIVRRGENWRRSGDGYIGGIEVNVSGVPGEIAARTSLSTSGERVTQRTDGEVTVRIPLFGGKIESAVADQVTTLLRREAEFTARWLAEHA
ncbi:DUF2505 domain-containing protein [Amycolatopsis sp. PS_44_ISF1]|uniref:DUF2505 domain-containing protein n=1 Tax=Amycolatopsis sp. PS_44_ISF1 TaxID=2974917 RepID=UPI0028DF8251|nr:DUF2505 domain-containing protein [Amycolatopsis sp. PS_44_ISF1]MDT8909936.1 DUF2505 domain-containing protein [Amycolatopsis sp. PS_44_ISF1]